ncbi:MAG: M20/M25/M40 family metallo-hydrolase [Bradymonadaceae bacterium]
MSKLQDNLVDQIEGTIRSNNEDLISLRRHFHAHPELSHQEFETTETLEAKLEKLGYEVHVRPEGTGLYADLVPEGFECHADPTVAIRSDIDGLPIEEQNDVPYKSKKDGVMHACGHDVHMAAVIGAAMATKELGDDLPGRGRRDGLVRRHRRSRRHPRDARRPGAGDRQDRHPRGGVYGGLRRF